MSSSFVSRRQGFACRRWRNRKRDVGRHFPTLGRVDPCNDHQEWLRGRGLAGVGDRDIERRVGFRDVRSQAHGLHPILVRRHYEGFGVEVLKVLHDDVSTPESDQLPSTGLSLLATKSVSRELPDHPAPCAQVVPVLRLDERSLASGDFIEGRGVSGLLGRAGAMTTPRQG